MAPLTEKQRLAMDGTEYVPPRFDMTPSDAANTAEMVVRAVNSLLSFVKRTSS